MVSLIRYECKKHFLTKFMLAALAVFSVINVIKIYAVYSSESPLADEANWKQVYWQLYEDFSGEISNKKINELLSIFHPLEEKTADRTATNAMGIPGTYTGNLYSDYHLLNWYFVKPMEYAYMYRNMALKVAATAQENILLYRQAGNTYEALKDTIIADRFADRRIDNYFYTEMFQYLVQYDFSVLLVLLLAIYGTASIFSYEKETDMELILLTARFGGRSTVLAKIISAILFTSVICAWFWMLDFVAFSFAFSSLEAGETPIYALRDFAYSPIGIPLGCYLILSASSKTMGIVALCMSFLLFASFFRTALQPFIANALFTIGIIVCGETLMGSSQTWLKVLNPFILVMNRDLYHKTEFVNIAGHPILSYVAAYIAGALWIIGFGALTILLSQKNTFQKAR
jgi:hypothetical protein